jgi:hypothetical protein
MRGGGKTVPVTLDTETIVLTVPSYDIFTNRNRENIFLLKKNLFFWIHTYTVLVGKTEGNRPPGARILADRIMLKWTLGR